MEYIFLAPGTERITVADAFKTLLGVPAAGVVENDIQPDFLTFCGREKVRPVCDGSPFSEYTGEGLQNGLCTISIDELKRFAEPYGLQVEVGVEWIHVPGIVAGESEGFPSEKTYQEHLKARAACHAEGRYTLNEAAMEISKATGERAEELRDKLVQAVRDKTLPVYEPGRNARLICATVRPGLDEARWHELNDWLKDKEPHIDFEFPNPADEAPQSTIKRGVVKSKILEVDWPMGPAQSAVVSTKHNVPSLKSVLDDIPAWVNSACIKDGRPGRGRGSHKWNPPLLAVCLYSTTPHKKWSSPVAALTKVIEVHYKDYLAEWIAMKEQF